MSFSMCAVWYSSWLVFLLVGIGTNCPMNLFLFFKYLIQYFQEIDRVVWFCPMFHQYPMDSLLKILPCKIEDHQ